MQKMNMMEYGHKCRLAQQVEHNSIEAEYVTDNGRFTVHAIPGRAGRSSHTAENIILDASTVSFTILADELPVDPQIGDRIEADGRFYEVNTPLGSNGCWRWSDGYLTARRVFCKGVDLNE